MKSLRSLSKVLPLFLLVFLLGAASLQADTPLNPYEQDDKVVLLDDTFMSQFRIFVGAVAVIFFLAMFAVYGALHKNPQKLTLMGLINGITGKGSSDPEMHHEYDGIRELDNPIPGYLQMIMYGSIVFAVVYLAHYHFLGTGPLSGEEYQIEMAEAELKYKDVELPESALIRITDISRLEKAATVFDANCATCHRTDLGGDSGPNLTDPYWLHGGDIKAIYATITNGVPGKTMIGWKKKISSQQRLELASYIMSKQGTNPADPKEPEGTVDGQEGEQDKDVVAPGEDGQEGGIGQNGTPTDGEEDNNEDAEDGDPTTGVDPADGETLMSEAK